MRRFLLIAAALAAASCASASVASAGVLNVTLAGSGAGTVTSSPAGIDCSNVPGSAQTACSYDYGFTQFGGATLTATPGEGSGFVAWSGTAGGTCMGGTNPCVTQSLLLGGTAVATFAPAPDAPAVSTGQASGVEFPSATVNGTVNPGSDDFAVSDCYFEYGLTTDYGEKAACHTGSIGTGTSPVAVSASVGVLDPGRTYHYRLAATNGGGTSHGEDQTFTSGAAPADPCPNAAIRAQQGALAQRLPRCRAYEMVSPSFTSGQIASVSAMGSADGSDVMLASVGGFAGTENLPDLGVQYASVRTAEGWRTSAIAPPASSFPFIGTYAALDWVRDGSRSLWFVNLKADQGTNRFTPIVRDPDGSFHVAGPTQDDQQNLPGGASEDLRTVVQRTTTRPALTDGTVDDRSSSSISLYTSTRDEGGQLSVGQVAFRGGATMFPSCGIELGGVNSVGGSHDGRNAISSDGRKIFFTSATGQGSCATPAVRRVWAKVGDEEPVDLSASLCTATCGAQAVTNFRGASRDGSRVYFTTTQRLVPEDEDTSAQNDLYEYDFNAVGQRLRLVTGSDAPAGAGVSAASGLVKVSQDGSYVYFVASGRPLAGPNARGVAPQPGDDNLYAYHRAAGQPSGTTTFVGAVGSSYGVAPQTSSSGRHLLFQTTADLTGDRIAGDGHTDLYRYDAQEDELLRVWTDDPAHNGASRIGGATVSAGSNTFGSSPSPASSRNSTGGWTGRLQISDDGSLVGFTTAEPLSRDDRNTATDAYLWDAATGGMTMLTSGTSSLGNRFQGSAFSGMTPSGDTLSVMSASPLLREHTSGQNAAYVIRRDGGFPEKPAPRDPCVPAIDCQTDTPPAPAPDAPAGTSTFVGPGNVLLKSPESPKPSAKIRVSKIKTVRRTSTRAKVRVPEKGKIRVSGRNLVRTSKTASKSGTVRVLVKLTKRGRQKLRRDGRVKTRVNVRFVPENGKSMRKRVSVTFRTKAKKRKSSESRSARTSNVQSSDVRKGR